MKANSIKVGMVLELKPERAEAYGFKSHERFVTVTRIKERPGYKTPWIIQEPGKDSLYEAYKPSDFKGQVLGLNEPYKTA